MLRNTVFLCVLCAFAVNLVFLSIVHAARVPAVPKAHPYLLGSRADLQALAKARPEEFERMQAVARDTSAPPYWRGMSLALVAAVDEDQKTAREAQQLAMKIVNGPIRQGHVTFGTDLALCGVIYDLCYDAWPEADRAKFHDYFNKTVDANVLSETHVFHNAWYAYKNCGIGVGALASYHENSRAPEIFATMDNDYRTRAAPALQLAGAGGGWAEGYYIHYWLYDWLFFCEIARRCASIDYYALAPDFYRNRALASAFEMYPGIDDHRSRRPVPMGDGGGRVFGGDRDKALSARRILVSYYRDDSTHQAIHAFNELTPRSGSSTNAYKDFLWHDTTVPKGDVRSLPLSHYSPGAGFVYARSSWDDDATYFFFKAGDRFTAHQHLDNGHFLIYRNAELAGDGGHYGAFGSRHDVNYQLRTIAHSTLLIHDPDEKWPDIRLGKPTGNDGGQHHNWPHHNGAVSDAEEWQKNRELYNVADITDFHADADSLCITADITRSYSGDKAEKVIRQVVYLRPSTFVILDEVIAKRAEFKKTWLLQAMKPPTPIHADGVNELMIENGGGRLFVQTLLPADAQTHVARGQELYKYDSDTFNPEHTNGPAPEARIEISPRTAAQADTFLHVLTAADVATEQVPAAQLDRTQPGELRLRIGELRILFPATSRPVIGK